MEEKETLNRSGSIKNSRMGDEIIGQNKDGIQIYISKGEQDFYKLSREPNEEGKTVMKFGSTLLKASQVMKELENEPRVIYNRNKYTQAEVQEMTKGMPLEKYNTISGNYKGQKKETDRLVTIRDKMMMVKPGDELNSFEYKNGKQVRRATYICVGNDEQNMPRFREAVKAKLWQLGNNAELEKRVRHVFYNSKQRTDLTVDEIMNRVVKEQTMTPKGYFAVFNKPGKYTTRDLYKLAAQERLNDEVIEKRWHDWRRSEKVIQPIKGQEDEYLMSWKDRKTGEILQQTMTNIKGIEYMKAREVPMKILDEPVELMKEKNKELQKETPARKIGIHKEREGKANER